jgi:hypothetical protein
MGWTYSINGRDEKLVQNFNLKPEGNVPVRKTGNGLKGNIKMDLKELWYEDVDWVN